LLQAAVGYTLDEIPNDISKTPACFEPDNRLRRCQNPKWQFEKFPGPMRRWPADEVRWAK